MIPLSKTARLIEKKENIGVFEIEALYPGYGITIGNSLRRVLLSSLQGAAVTQVKIKGVPHEFSTIDGVLEDVISILLNIKQMRFKLFSDEPQKAVLKVKGEREVTGADFKLPPQVELVNKDIHIASLTQKNTELEMEIQIEKGIGYVPAKLRKEGRQEIGVIALDAIFTPIKKVGFKVDHMRVGERTDFDRLTLTIETDGTLSPEEALFQASQILVKQFEVIGAGVKPKTEEKISVSQTPLETKTTKRTHTSKKEK